MTDAPDPARDEHDRADDPSEASPQNAVDDSLDDTVLATGQTTSALGVSAGGGEATLDAYDLDDDGKVSLVEAARAQLGVVDARLEEAAEHGGLTGRLADAAHHVVDRLDNDDEPDAGDA
jgi:hypothetical protein